jgi:hypothetical protein
VALGIALILIVIGALAIAGHASVVDQGVNAGARVSTAVDDSRRSAVRAGKSAAATAAEGAA